jgi:hypothetical protein
MSSLCKLSAAAPAAAGVVGLLTAVRPQAGAAPNPNSTLVHVTNRIIDAVPVDPSPIRPYQVTIGISLADGSFSDTDSAPIPAGRRFVIQTVTGTASLPPGQRPKATVSAQLIDADGNPGTDVGLVADHYFPFADQGLEDGGNAALSSPGRSRCTPTRAEPSASRSRAAVRPARRRLR